MSTWKSIKQQSYVDIQTTNSAFIMKIPSALRGLKYVDQWLLGKGFHGLTSPLIASKGPTLTITTIQGHWTPSEDSSVSDDFVMFPSARPLPGLELSLSPDEVGERRFVQSCRPDRDDPSGPAARQFSLLTEPTLCTSKGPFRLTGPGWDGALTLRIKETVGGGATIQVAKEGQNGHVQQWEIVGSELHVWIQSRNPSKNEEVSLVVVKLHCA
ncbi:MAG: hypothetical protein P1V97_08815 [Planctomycetota bacterium]|nr:hypothetical protein [Planctomycetota bacterium]